jgi:Domain of Unknown Function (DUF1080)
MLPKLNHTKIHTICLLALIFISQGTAAQPANQLTNAEKRRGWSLLFDGKTTKGWHTYLQSTAVGWNVTPAGNLLFNPNTEATGDLVTDSEYENFDLSLEWCISEGGNSGIIFGIHEVPELKETYLSGVEMQILDDIHASDNKKANHLAGSLYDMKEPARAAVKVVGEWNVARIRKKNGHLVFWLNGIKIVEEQMGNNEWKNMLMNSKFKTWKDFAAYPKGHISLQGHGSPVQFRNIKINEL